MTFQIIVSTMNQKTDDLLSKMNINSDAIIINQCSKVAFHEIDNGSTIKWYDFNEYGIGLSRNSGLMRASADIIQFADDDMVLNDNYVKLILDEYEKHPEADVILFSNKCLNNDRMPYEVKEFAKVGRVEGVNFGGARITARRNKILYNNIYFSLLFGGGSKYCAGEDVTFVQDCIKAGLKVYKSPVVLSTMKQDSSTWFNGYNDKYFIDKGALVAKNFPWLCRIGIYYLAYKNYKHSNKSYVEVLKLYRVGMEEYLANK